VLYVVLPDAEKRERRAAREKEKQEKEASEKKKRPAPGDGDATSSATGGSSNGSKKARTEEVRCRHILVKHRGSRRPQSHKSSNITRTRDEAYRLIRDYRERIRSGQAKFEDLAIQESDCSYALYIISSSHSCITHDVCGITGVIVVVVIWADLLAARCNLHLSKLRMSCQLTPSLLPYYAHENTCLYVTPSAFDHHTCMVGAFIGSH
jgi:hypothetical protein